MIEKVFLVALGGAIGAVLRFLSAGWVGRMFGEVAIGTMFVNIVGSFLMGVCAVWILERVPEFGMRMGLFLLTGVFGGFTTFSAFSLDALRLYESGRLTVAAGYVGGSVVLSILALFAGVVLARAAWA